MTKNNDTDGATAPTQQKFVHTVYCRFMVAVLGAWAAELVTFPFDLVKTRLQIQSEVATAKHGHMLEKRGMLSTGINVAKNEGILHLWSGLTPIFHRHVLYAGSRLVIYEKLRSFLVKDKKDVSILTAGFAGVTAGAMAQFIASPTDLVRVQMQAEGRRKLQGMKPRYRGCLHLYSVVYRELGFFGMWRGANPNVIRAAMVNLGDLAAYDYSKQFLMRTFGLPDGLWAHGGAAAIAGFVAAALATPADTMRTRMMNQPTGPDGRPLLYKGLIDCIQQSVKNEGFFSLYKGFLPLWLRLGPWAMVNWLAFENIMILIGGKTF